MSDPIKFLENEHTKESLDGMTDDALLELRNLVASNLGVAGVKSFKDHATAVAQTWKALERYRDDTSEEAPAKVKKKKEPKEPKEYKLAKSAMAGTVKRPNRKHFATIKKIGEHDGASHGRAHRWPNYTDGMMMIDVIEKEGTEAWDVYNWEKMGIMSVTEPTDEEYATRRAAWYEKQGRKDPDVEKAEKAAAREKAKAEAAAAKAAAESEAE